MHKLRPPAFRKIQNLRHSRRSVIGSKPSVVLADRGAIVCVKYNTLVQFGAALEAQYRLRYRTFVERRYWSGVRWFHGMEYDQYDTPAAHYLVYLSPEGFAWGCLRIAPTDRPYMLKDHWPYLCTATALPESMSVWEMTRLCVDQELPKEVRRRVRNVLICALLEFTLANDIQKLIAVAHPKVWQSVFIDTGWDVKFLGDESMLEDGVVRAGIVSVSLPLLKCVRKNLASDGSVLKLE